MAASKFCPLHPTQALQESVALHLSLRWTRMHSLSSYQENACTEALALALALVLALALDIDACVEVREDCPMRANTYSLGWW